MTRQFSNSEFEDILIYFTHSILGSNTEDEIAWDLAKNCISRLGFVDCVVYFIDQDTNQLVQKAAYGPKNPKEFTISDPISIPLGQGITGTAALAGKTEIVSDTSLDDRYIVDDEIRLSEISVPILIEGRVMGVIDCEHPQKNFFTPQHQKILEAIASICSVKISNVRAQKAIQHKQQHLLSIQRELLSVKAEALRAQMNPHFVFNAINAIQYFITAGDKPASLRFLNTFSHLIRYYINNFEKDEITLKNEVKLVEWYLQLQKMRYMDRFKYRFIQNLNEASLSHKIPTLILGAVVENVIEGTVFDNNTQGSAKITLSLRDKKLHLSSLYTVSKSAGNPQKSINYRENLNNWEQQIEVINRLKGLQITKEMRERDLSRSSMVIRSIKIIIPVLPYEDID